jgi:2'-5' RNA ligase
MPQSGLVVCVPEAEGVVGSLRERFDSSASLGVPAHITVLFPFMSPDAIDAVVLQRVQRVVSKATAFEFSLTQANRFPATAYLEPIPPAPFIALTERLVSEFPEFPPFGGIFPTIIPHLTVAHGSSSEAEVAEAELLTLLAAHGPVKSECTSLVLLENSTGLWRQMHVFPLAPSSSGTRSSRSPSDG